MVVEQSSNVLMDMSSLEEIKQKCCEVVGDIIAQCKPFSIPDFEIKYLVNDHGKRTGVGVVLRLSGRYSYLTGGTAFISAGGGSVCTASAQGTR